MKTYRLTWDELMSRRSEIAPDAVLEVKVYQSEESIQIDSKNQALFSLLQSWREENASQDAHQQERRNRRTYRQLAVEPAGVAASRITIIQAVIADIHALDGDAIAAAQALSLGLFAAEYVIATSNVKHISRFASADFWTNIYP